MAITCVTQRPTDPLAQTNARATTHAHTPIQGAPGHYNNHTKQQDHSLMFEDGSLIFVLL